MQRREMLKLAAMSAATAVVHPNQAHSHLLPILNQPEDADDLKWDKAPCRFCGTGCHVLVGVQDGKVVAVAGDKLAAVNKGLLCVKGYHVGLALYGEDRLKHPQLRKNGKLERISPGTEAIETIAETDHGCPGEDLPFTALASGLSPKAMRLRS